MSNNSPFGNLYLRLKDRLKDNAPSIRWIDQDFGQLDHFELRPAVSFPCTLIDIDETAFDESGGSELCQLGEGIIKVRIGLDIQAGTNHLAPDSSIDDGLNCYELEQEVFEALHGYSADNFKKLIRVSAVTEKRNDQYRVRVLRFKVSMEDKSARPKKTVIARPNMELNAS